MVRFTEAEVVEVWDRWQAGDANRLIGRDLGRSAGSIRAFVEASGGVRPPVRLRSELHLSLHEREEISRGVAAGDSLRMIAGRLGRAASTISRELARNGGRSGYRAQCHHQRNSPKCCNDPLSSQHLSASWTRVGEGRILRPGCALTCRA